MRYARDFTITRQVSQQFYQLLALRRWGKGAVAFAVLGALVAWLYIDWLGFALELPGKIIVAVVFGLFTAVIILALMILRTRSKVSAALRRSRRESYVQQTRIDGFGVHVTVDKTDAKLDFDRILRVEETASAFYIFLTEADAWILPKDQMENAEEESGTIREIFSKVVVQKRLKLLK